MSDLYKEFWKQLEESRVKQAQKLHDWYFNDRDEIIQHVETALGKMFRKGTLDQINIRVRNIVPRVVNKVCQVYKQPAKRMLDGGLQVQITGQAVTEKQSPEDKNYQEVLNNSTINRKSKEWHRLGVFFNTVLVQPIWVKSSKGNYLDFMIHTPAYTIVETDSLNWNIPIAFYYPTEMVLGGEDSEEALVYWSQTEHFILDKFGNKYAPADNPGMVNPYGILPVAVLRFRDAEDFWGEGKWSLVEGNEEVAAQYSNLGFTAIFQSHGQPVAINTGLKGEPEVGPDKPIKIENAGGDNKQDSSFKFESANPMIQEVQGLIDWYIKSLMSDEGLSPQQYATEIANSSGVAKILDDADLNELRDDDRQILEDFEHDLYTVTAKVYNVEAKSKKLPEKGDFSIEFAEQKVVKTTDEKIKERESGIKMGTKSRVDCIREDNPELTEEQAKDKLKQIMLENKEFEDKFGLFGDSTANTVNDNTNNDLNPDGISKSEAGVTA